MAGRTAKRLEGNALFEYAVRVLAGRACSTGELKQKLRNRAAREEDVDGVLARLKDYGYLDDRRFAESFAAARLQNQKFGRTRVLQDLRQHRVAPALAESTVGNLYENVDEQVLIEDWIRRKYRTAPRQSLFHDEKDLASAYRKLLRAGFRSGDIVRVLKKFARNPDLLDGFEPPEEAGEEG